MAQLRIENTPAQARRVEMPEGPTQRHKLLKMNYLCRMPAISIHRARAITEIDKANPACRA